ncbi:hypothetical protein J6590_081966 [Homalodisca vitripennis]|nr:hypothetical protein J6590_081966 [Homalodisca vitripennis]
MTSPGKQSITKQAEHIDTWLDCPLIRWAAFFPLSCDIRVSSRPLSSNRGPLSPESIRVSDDKKRSGTRGGEAPGTLWVSGYRSDPGPVRQNLRDVRDKPSGMWTAFRAHTSNRHRSTAPWGSVGRRAYIGQSPGWRKVSV